MEFKIRSYGRSELAGLYRPDISQKNAWETLKNWIRENPQLQQKLFPPHRNKTSRSFTPAEVKMIVDVLGEP